MVAWVVDKENKVHPQPIEVEGSYGNSWIVSTGLNEDDTIVTEGFQRLRPGVEVEASSPTLAQAQAQ